MFDGLDNRKPPAQRDDEDIWERRGEGQKVKWSEGTGSGQPGDWIGWL